MPMIPCKCAERGWVCIPLAGFKMLRLRSLNVAAASASASLKRHFVNNYYIPQLT